MEEIKYSPTWLHDDTYTPLKTITYSQDLALDPDIVRGLRATECEPISELIEVLLDGYRQKLHATLPSILVEAKMASSADVVKFRAEADILKIQSR